jgi:RHS repeat-associated protein
VSSITDTLAGDIPLTLSFDYGLGNQRIKTTTTRNSTVERVKYFDVNYEEDSTTSGVKKYHYINGGTGLTAIFVKEGSGNDTMYHILSDHLGSLTTIVNASSNEVKNFSYNAWGIPRVADDWTSEYTGELFAGRGFTGHEHLAEFSLINMNGRVYDPILGRFLSPDPYVQSPAYPNNYNRYAYALNNPLIYTATGPRRNRHTINRIRRFLNFHLILTGS